MDEQKAMLEELVSAFAEFSLTRFCLFGYSVGGKFLLRFWPNMKQTLVARQPQAQMLCLIVAAGFLITEAGDKWLRGTLTLELMKKNDKRFSLLARQHGRGLPLVLKTMRKLLWGPSENMEPGERFLYSSTREERELIQKDPSVTIIMSELDKFYPPSTLWLPDDPVQPPPLGFDLSQASEYAPVEEIRAILDSQLPKYRAAAARSPGARLQFSKGDHIPMASGVYQTLTRELVARVIIEWFNDPAVPNSPASLPSSSSSSSSLPTRSRL